MLRRQIVNLSKTVPVNFMRPPRLPLRRQKMSKKTEISSWTADDVRRQEIYEYRFAYKHHRQQTGERKIRYVPVQLFQIGPRNVQESE